MPPSRAHTPCCKHTVRCWPSCPNNHCHRCAQRPCCVVRRVKRVLYSRNVVLPPGPAVVPATKPSAQPYRSAHGQQQQVVKPGRRQKPPYNAGRRHTADATKARWRLPCCLAINARRKSNGVLSVLPTCAGPAHTTGAGPPGSEQKTQPASAGAGCCCLCCCYCTRAAAAAAAPRTRQAARTVRPQAWHLAAAGLSCCGLCCCLWRCCSCCCLLAALPTQTPVGVQPCVALSGTAATKGAGLLVGRAAG